MTLHSVKLGFIPLVDAGPLIIARELGFAEEERLQIDLIAARSWSRLRDMLVFEQVEAAHMLSAVPVSTALGLGGAAARLEALMVLSMGGEMIGLSRGLAAEIRAAGPYPAFTDAPAAAAALSAARPGGLRIGVPFVFSMHAELLHLWLGALPGLRLLTVPPSQMAEALAAGEIEAFCVGEPWGSFCVEQGAGELLLPGSAIWGRAPEKVLAVRAGWAEAHPETAGRLMRALWRACRWLGDPGNRMTASEILAREAYLDVSADLIERALSGNIITRPEGDAARADNFVLFHEYGVNYPWPEQADWIGRGLAQRVGLPAATAQAARAAFRGDLYALHMAGTGAEIPGSTATDSPGSGTAEAGTPFAQGRVFSPALPQ